jgi:putative ABC transport system substrate-binding protein
VDRKRFLVLIVGGFLAAPLAAEAQQAGKVYRIGLLGASPPGSPGWRLWEAFFQGLRDLGYTEGRDFIVEGRYSEGREERLSELAGELVRLHVDVIVAGAGQPVHAVSRATTTIPIVMANHGDPVGSGLVASLAHPGGNITGLSILNPEVTGKRLELLKVAVPGLTRVAALWNPGNQIHRQDLGQAQAAARGLGLQLHGLPVRSPDEYEGAFSAMVKERAGALLVLGDLTVWLNRGRIAELAARNRLPAMYVQREHVEAGGLMAYGVNLADNYRRAAVYVDKILKGTKPADLPIEQPTEFDLVINLKTAKALGLTIPQSLLLRADEVIQ